MEYEVQVSDDGLEARLTEVQWRTLRRVTDGQDETRTLQGLGGHGRYLRIVGLKPGPFPLYSIWEIESPGAPPQAITGTGQVFAEMTCGGRPWPGRQSGRTEQAGAFRRREDRPRSAEIGLWHNCRGKGGHPCFTCLSWLHWAHRRHL